MSEYPSSRQITIASFSVKSASHISRNPSSSHTSMLVMLTMPQVPLVCPLSVALIFPNWVAVSHAVKVLKHIIISQITIYYMILAIMLH